MNQCPFGCHMNISEKNGILIEVSIGDFLDYYTINQVRAERNKITSDLPVNSAIEKEADIVLKTLGCNSLIVEKLRAIHSKLWDCESKIRLISNDAEYLAAARSIFALNDERHKLKEEIDNLIPTRYARKRIYNRSDL